MTIPSTTEGISSIGSTVSPVLANNGTEEAMVMMTTTTPSAVATTTAVADNAAPLDNGNNKNNVMMPSPSFSSSSDSGGGADPPPPSSSSSSSSSSSGNAVKAAMILESSSPILVSTTTAVANKENKKTATSNVSTTSTTVTAPNNGSSNNTVAAAGSDNSVVVAATVVAEINSSGGKNEPITVLVGGVEKAAVTTTTNTHTDVMLALESDESDDEITIIPEKKTNRKRKTVSTTIRAAASSLISDDVDERVNNNNSTDGSVISVSSNKGEKTFPTTSLSTTTIPAIAVGEGTTTVTTMTTAKKSLVLTDDETAAAAEVVPPVDGAIPAPEIGPGWTKTVKYDPNSNSDRKYFYTPKLKLRLRSRPEIERFQKALEMIGDGDELKAYKSADRVGGRSRCTQKDHDFDSDVHIDNIIVKKRKRGRPSKSSSKSCLLSSPPPPPSQQEIKRKRGRPSKSSPAAAAATKGSNAVKGSSSVYDEEQTCIGCGKRFKNKQGLGMHLKFCDRYKALVEKSGSSIAAADITTTKEPPKKKQKTNINNNNNKKRKDDHQEEKKDEDGDGWFVVEAVRGRRINSETKKEEYLIKWKDFPESQNTWEMYEILNPIVQNEAREWYKEYKADKKEEKIRALKREEDMKRLGLLGGNNDSDDDDDEDMSLEDENDTITIQRGLATEEDITATTSRRGNKSIAKPNEPCVEDTTWTWDDVSQIQYREVRRINVNEPNSRQLVTDARINGTPVVLTGHPGWTNFAKRWMRRRRIPLPIPPVIPATAASAVSIPCTTPSTTTENNTISTTTVVTDVASAAVTTTINSVTTTANNTTAAAPSDVASAPEKTNAENNDTTATPSTAAENKTIGTTATFTVASAAVMTTIASVTSPRAANTTTTTTASSDVASTPETSNAENKDTTAVADAPCVKGVTDSTMTTRLEDQPTTTTIAVTAAAAPPTAASRDATDSSKDLPMDTETTTTNEGPAVDLAATNAEETTAKNDNRSLNNVKKKNNNKKKSITSTTEYEYHDGSIEDDTDLLDLSDPSWYLDVKAMSDDIGNEEVPVVKRNYNENKPISGNILASKFFEAAWPSDPDDDPKNKNNNVMNTTNSTVETTTTSFSSSSWKKKKKKKSTLLYLHQWQFPLSESACNKFCHKSVPLPNHILGEDLLKYWLDRVKLDSPLQYLFMGKEDTMSKLHKDPGGLAISIAPITGEKECVLVHRDDGHACLYHTSASVDPDSIDLDAYPLLPYARIWKTTIVPGEILLMPHGTYHQCRNVSSCLSYSRFHLDVVNLRAFLQSLFDGDAPELQQDEVLWNASQELINIIETATDEKRSVNSELIDVVDALRALRNITREITRKLHVRQTVKGISSSDSTSLLSAVKIDGDMEIWQKLVDDIDITLHEFRYRFNPKLPPFRKKRLVGKKILALPAMAFRGKAKPIELDKMKGKNDEPVIAFECPTDRGFLSLPEAPKVLPTKEERKIILDDIQSIVPGDTVLVKIEGKQCTGNVIEIFHNINVAYMSFEDLPSLYNDYLPCDLIRIPSIGGSVEPPLEEIQPGKLMIGLIGKDEYRAIVQHVKIQAIKMFKVVLDFGNEYTVDRLIDIDSILKVVSTKKSHDNNDNIITNTNTTDDVPTKKKKTTNNNNKKDISSDNQQISSLSFTAATVPPTTTTINNNNPSVGSSIKTLTEEETMMMMKMKVEETNNNELSAETNSKKDNNEEEGKYDNRIENTDDNKKEEKKNNNNEIGKE